VMSMGVLVVVMIVVAMLVMMMMVIMMVMMPVVIKVVAMFMRGMIVRRMIMSGMRRRGLGRVGMSGIGAAFGIERRLDLDDARAKPLHHRLDDVVETAEQTHRPDLRRPVPVPHAPGIA